MMFEDQYRQVHEKPEGEPITIRLSAYGVMFDEERNALFMVKQTNIGRWEFPGGGVEEGETIIEGMKREYLEEADMNIELVDDQPMHVSERWFCNADTMTFHHAPVFHYEVRSLGVAENASDYVPPEEFTEKCFVTLEELTEDNCQRTCWPIIKLLKER